MRFLALLLLVSACSGDTAIITQPEPTPTLQSAESDFYEAIAAAQSAHQRAWRLGSRLGVAFVWADTTQAPQYLVIPRGR